MKAIEQYFYVVLFTMLYKMAVSLSLYEILVWYYSNGRHCLVMLCKLVITYKTVGSKSLVYDHSNESYLAERLYGVTRLEKYCTRIPYIPCTWEDTIVPCELATKTLVKANQIWTVETP